MLKPEWLLAFAVAAVYPVCDVCSQVRTTSVTATEDDVDPCSDGVTFEAIKAKRGGRIDWLYDGNLIAFDSRATGRFNIYTMNPDGSRQRCVTCTDERIVLIDLVDCLVN